MIIDADLQGEGGVEGAVRRRWPSSLHLVVEPAEAASKEREGKGGV